jgi:hypothetical protein
MSISFGGSIIADLRADSIHGARMLGAYLIRFSLNYNMPAWPGKDYRFSNIRARISVGNEQRLLGFALAEQAIVLASGDYNQHGSFLLDIPLTAEQIEEIEKLRLGGDIDYKLDIYGELCSGHDYSSSNDTIHLHVNQKTWIDLLKQINFSCKILVEMPQDDNAAHISVMRVMEKAREHLYYGNYDEVVANCRKAMEGIKLDREEIQTIRKLASGNRKSMSKKERLVYLLDALEHYMHPAHHLDHEDDPVPYTRKDAIFVYGATISAVSAYS